MDIDRVNELGFEKNPKWHNVVLIIAFNRWWNIFIGAQCFVTFVLCTYTFTYRTDSSQILIIRYLIDLCYLLEIVCNILYRKYPTLRKQKYVKTRGWLCIFVDIISVLPLDLLYFIHGFGNERSEIVEVSVIQNRLLRIYRIVLLESLYETIARKPYQYMLICIFQYTFRILVVSILLNSVWVLVDKSVVCPADKFNCQAWYQINMLSLVMLNWQGKETTFGKPWERVIASAAMLSGFFIVFCYVYPKIFYFSMQMSNKRALFYEEFGKLQAFFRNMVFDPKLKAQILHRFNDVWSKGRVDDMGSLFRNFPLCLRMDISADIYWESLRHSELFREVSRSCKRSLAMLMTTEYYHPEEVIYHKGQEILKMMFLVQGILQVMAEENEEFPLLSFSSGSVFGEVSLFFYLKSQVILKCKAYSQLQILTLRAAMTVLKDYPKDRKLVLHNLHERFSMAKYTQWRKRKFILEEKLEMLTLENTAVEDSVKWLKKQWRGVWESHERHVKVMKARENGLRLHSWQTQLQTEVRIEFVSNYLDLIVLSDFLEEKKDVVCFKTGFPWSINPSAQFLRVWYFVVLITSLFPALLYPAFTAWTSRFPRWVYNLSFVVTLIFIADVVLKLFTAVQTKEKMITNFWAVLRQLSQEPTFYFDVIAAFPYQIFIICSQDIDTSESHKIGLFLHPALLKSYLVLMLKVPLGDFMDRITVFKNCLIYFLLLYWTAELTQLLGVRNLGGIYPNWMDRFFKKKANEVDELEMHFLSVFYALIRAMSIPDYVMYSDNTFTMICSLGSRYFFFLFMCFFLSQLYASFTVKIYASETFQVLMKRIARFLENIYVSERTTRRLLHSLNFQWNYDKADYLSSKMTIIKSIPVNLRAEVYSETTFKTLRSCRFFEEESADFLSEVLESSYLVAVPRGSVLATFGHTSHLISIIHRGYCQINSYLSKDVSSEIGRSIEMGPGQVFPLLSSLCCIPSPASVITTTDCEVIMIHMNDLLAIMFKYQVVKDVMEVMVELNVEKVLLDVEPGLLTVQLNSSPGDVDKEVVKKSFEEMGVFWKCLYMCCPKKNILTRKFFWLWDTIYIIGLIFSSWLWPCCFGLFLKSSYLIIPFLTVAKVLSLANLMLGFYYSYFNEKGLLVTHPVYTCLNYLTSRFLLNFIQALPVYPIYLYGVSDSQQKPHPAAVLVLYFQLILYMLSVTGFLTESGDLLKNSYINRMLRVTLTLLLAFNAFVNFIMYINTDWIFGGPYRVVAFEPLPNRYPDNPEILEYNSEWDYYVFTAHWILSCLTTNDYRIYNTTGTQLYVQYVQGFVGTIGLFFLYVWVASNSIFANIRGTIYQEKVFSFINYLKYEEADDVLINYVNSYYNYEWSQTRGESLKVFCRHLPMHLHEELVYPIYRMSFAGNALLAGADEGFFKILATQVESVFFNRGSVIMFKDEVQANIFFVHKGKCFVFDWFLVLGKSSFFGDIQRSGVIRNKVYALTHVELLRISSDEFFKILNNFYSLEADFLYRMKTAENFVKGDMVKSSHRLRPVDSKDVLNAFCLKKRAVLFRDESTFEDLENSFIQVLKMLKFSQRKKHRMWIIYPGTWKMNAYRTLQVTVTIVTLLSLPIFSSFGALTVTAFVVIGVTDFFWLVVVILTFRVGIIDSQKGDVITDFKLIAENYLKRVDGLVMDVVSLIPLELIPVGIAKGIQSADWRYVTIARMVRVLRGRVFYQILKNETEQLDSRICLKYFFVIVFFIIILFQSVALYVVIATEPTIVNAINHHELKEEQFFAFVMALEYVINFVSSANLAVIVPNTRSQLHFFNTQIVIYVGIKSFLISKILSLLYVSGVATAYYKSRTLESESYLQEKETSPSIISEVLSYRSNLLQLSRSENTPSLLRKGPAAIRITVMRDIYIDHLVNCALFENVEEFFLNQLVARAFRELYFPGQKILEQGEVNHRMYFVHSGEVYLMNQTKGKAYVEYVVRIIQAGESFGEAQGLWLSIPHSFTYRARTVVDMLVLCSCDWIDLRRSFPNIVKKIFYKAKTLRYI